LPRPEKEERVRQLAEKVASTTATLLTDYQGLDVESITELRRTFREANIEFRVFKNTLAKLAAESAGVPDLKPFIDGPTAYAFSDDPVTPAKIIAEFAKKHPFLRLKGGVVEMNVLTAEQAGELATLPPLPTLQAMAVTQLKSPLYALANALAAMIRMLVYALDGICKQKQEESTEEKVESEEEN
jgi:large subunit ribosomal protein L10